VAHTLADTIAAIDQSAIVDLDSYSRTKQEKFLAPFLDRFYEINRNPLLLICDESDRYAPQKPMTSAAIFSLSSSEDIARRGRKRGIGSFWLTQRTAVLNKNVSEFANLVVVFRTPGSKDLAELEDRVGRIAAKDVVKEVVRLAPGLNDGEAFFLSSHPKLRKFMPDPVRPIQLPMPWTFDSSATPGVGQRRREPRVLAKTDLAAIESKMAAQVEQAKANDPAALKRRILELEKQVKDRPAAPAPAPKIVEKKIVTDAQVKRVESVAMRLEKEGLRRIEAAAKMEATGRELIQTAQAFSVALAKASGAVNPVAALARPPVIQRQIVGPAPASRVAPVAGTGRYEASSGELSKGARNILVATAQHSEGVTRDQLTVLCGYKRSSRDTYLQQLKQNGFIDQSGHRILATDEGVAALGTDYEPLPTGDALREHWLNRLSGGERKILEVLIEKYPSEVPRDDLSEATGYLRSSRDTYLQKLASRRLIENVGRGEVRAADQLFDQIHA